MRLSLLVGFLGCMLAGRASAVSFDDPLPPDRIQSSARLASGNVSGGAVLAAIHPGYDSATHCAGAVKVMGLAMQELPYERDTLAVATKQEPCAGASPASDHAWNIAIWLVKPDASGHMAVLARGAIPEASGLQAAATGGNDDAVLEGFDFARFDTAPGQRAFGLRWHAFASGTGAATESHNVTLCWNDGGVLRPVLTFAAKETETDVSPPSAEEATSDTVTEIRTLRVLPSLAGGHYDWRVTAKHGAATTYRWQGDHYESRSLDPRKDVTAESVLRGTH